MERKQKLRALVRTPASAERKAAEQPYLSEAQYRFLFDRAPLPVWLVDEKTLAFVEVNNFAVRHYGYSREEFLGMTLADIRPPEDLPVFLATFQKTSRPPIRSLDVGTRRWKHRKKDGTIIDVEIVTRRILFRGRPSRLTIINDITERVRAEESSAFLASIVESSSDAIVGENLDGSIVTWNAGAERLYGYPAREVLGRPMSVLIPPECSEELASITDCIRRGSILERHETLRLRKDGSRVDVAITVSPVRNAAGEIIGASTVARDISDRKRTEKALRDLSGRLLQIQDEERRHIARELHDSTAQRLAVLECNLRLLQQRSPGLDPAMRRNLEQSVALGGECSNELRTLAYLLHPPLLDELGLASALRAYISGHNQRRAIFVSLKLPRRLPRLGSDLEIAIFRIVQEALSNIYRHSKSKTAKIRLSASPRECILEVSDQGQGIAPDILQRLNEGTAILGVGIAGMRERVRQLGGRLEILSGPRGTTVRSVFPRQDPSAVTPRNNPSHTEQIHSVSHYTERSRRKTA